MQTFGKHMRISLAGASHASEMTAHVENFPSARVSLDDLQAFCDRRRPGNQAAQTFASARAEEDVPAFEGSGVMLEPGGHICDDYGCRLVGPTLVTNGDAFDIRISNKDAKPQDYAPYQAIPRPGTADLGAYLKYGAHYNMAGSAQFSGRMTAPLTVAGGMAKLYLAQTHGITIGAHLAHLGGVSDASAPTALTPAHLALLARKPLATFDAQAARAMQEALREAATQGDSLGAVIECFVLGIPAGLGGALTSGIESALAPGLFGIPGVKGVEFGAGFASAAMTGSKNNDPIVWAQVAEATASSEQRQVAEATAPVGRRPITLTNNAGGILGGITTGMPLVVRVACKPTPSIAKPQQTVNLATGEETTIEIAGRHDTCFAVRAVPVVEAVVALGLLDEILIAQRQEI